MHSIVFIFLFFSKVFVITLVPTCSCGLVRLRKTPNGSVHGREGICIQDLLLQYGGCSRLGGQDRHYPTLGK